MDSTPPEICPYCQSLVPVGSIYCSNCGKPLHEEKIQISTRRQIIIYLVSFFLPPLGLIWTFKYLKQSDPIKKRVGIVSLLLTVVAIILNFYALSVVMNLLSSQLNSINSLNSLTY